MGFSGAIENRLDACAAMGRNARRQSATKPLRQGLYGRNVARRRYAGAHKRLAGGALGADVDADVDADSDSDSDADSDVDADAGADADADADAEDRRLKRRRRTRRRQLR
jgi:hypothetical protein